MPVDVTVVGSGPNGLAAALTAARAGLSVRVIEGSDTIGGGARTEELVESGFLNDRCSAVHPMALASPFFRDFGLAERVSFVTPPGSYAHVSPEGCVSIAYRDLGRTAETLGEHDANRWRRLLGGLVRHLDEVTRLALSGVPVLASGTLPRWSTGFGRPCAASPG